MRITLRAESARQAGIETADDAASWEARLPDPPRPENYASDRFGLSPQMRGDTLHLWLNDLIDQWFGVNNEHLVAALGEAPDDAPIVLHVNCPGGSIFDARAMQATLADRQVEARVEGRAASAASWLMLVAETRTITVGSRVLVHETNGVFRGTTSEVAHDVVPLMQAMDAEVSSDYAAGTGGKAGDWLARMRADKGRGTEFDAAEAVKLGLVNSIIQTARKATNSDPGIGARNHARLRLAQIKTTEVA